MTGQRATETAENKQFPSRGALTSLLLLEPPMRFNTLCLLATSIQLLLQAHFLLESNGALVHRYLAECS